MPQTIRQFKRDKRTKKQKQADFIAAFVDLVSVSRAAVKAKVHRTVIYDWIKSDSNFKIIYEAACELATGKLEDEAVRRAFEGTVKPVYQGGKLVGKIREFSDTLLIVLLKARAPEKYKERVSNEHKIPDPIQTRSLDNLTFEQLYELKYGKPPA